MSKWLILGLTLAALGCGVVFWSNKDASAGGGGLESAAFANAIFAGVGFAVFGVLDVLVLLSTLFWRW